MHGFTLGATSFVLTRNKPEKSNAVDRVLLNTNHWKFHLFGENHFQRGMRIGNSKSYGLVGSMCKILSDFPDFRAINKCW